VYNADSCQYNQENEMPIIESKALLLPTAIALRHIPGWLRTRLIKRFNIPAKFSTNTLIIGYCTNYSEWMNHWGETTIANRSVFASETEFIDQYSAAEINEFASQVGLEVYYSPNSYWQPGKLIRIGFYVK